MDNCGENANGKVLDIAGSSRIILDYFEICLHNLLFQRNIYPKEEFKVVRKFGLNLVFSKNVEIINYIKLIIKQLHKWVYNDKIDWVTMLIVSKETNQINEKWMFHIDLKDNGNEKGIDNDLPEGKEYLELIQGEIQSIIRQITASITFLPEFEDEQTFKIIVNTNKLDLKTPKTWGDLDKNLVDLDGESVEHVKFNDLATNQHHVSTFVTYKPRDQ